MRTSIMIYELSAAAMLLTALGSVRASEPLVIQGRVTEIKDALVTLQTPAGYPGRTGGHAMFVTAGRTFKLDISHARVLLPDGRQVDKVPLAVGDRIVVVLNGPDTEPPGPGDPNQTYPASIVERIVQGDRITTH